MEMRKKADTGPRTDKKPKTEAEPIRVPEAMLGMLEPIDAVHEHPHNIKLGHNVKVIAASLKEHGWHAPIVADREGAILIGNGRWLAAKRLKQAEVPVLRVDDDVRQAARRMVEDNRAAEFSIWDIAEVRSLADEGVFDGLMDDLRLTDMLGLVVPPASPPEKESKLALDEVLADLPTMATWEVSFDADNAEAAELMARFDGMAGVVVRRL
jgi:hypothetical protein